LGNRKQRKGTQHLSPKRPKKTTTAPKPEEVFGHNGVIYRFPQGERGPIEIRIDFGLVPAPINYYYADSMHLEQDKNLRMAVLSFGRRKETTNKFADRIDVVMPEKSLFDQFWKSSAEIQGTLEKFLAMTGVPPKLQPVSAPESQATTFFANAIFAALGEGESTLDFYHMPPRAVHLAKTQKADIQLLPIVRVIISSVLTKYFFESLRPEAEARANFQSALEGNKLVARSK
jgi:hypothetical protein